MANCIAPDCSEVPFGKRIAVGETKRAGVQNGSPGSLGHWCNQSVASWIYSAFSRRAKVLSAGKRSKSHSPVAIHGPAERQARIDRRMAEGFAAARYKRPNKIAGSGAPIPSRGLHDAPRQPRGGEAQAVRRLQLTPARRKDADFRDAAFSRARICPSVWEGPNKPSGGSCRKTGGGLRAPEGNEYAR